ncbi:MAG: 3,4-dehydroadipyl-CoA semialdehyde dehydrogenase [Pigmentiphaga sp.]|uniref:3,4-dehydroadipyl-CoA semialdehyde dehydrogenase n=1 Tax=Pigmentiphaga sp. TaxID=1977564 RepID=UPI003B55B655
MNTPLLSNYVSGQWQAGTGAGTVLRDPVLGTELVRVDATGLHIPAAFRFARQQGSGALQALTYAERAALLAQCQKVLQANRDAYYDIALANSGTVKNDSAVDIDGGLFTLGQYARWGEALGGARALRDGDAVKLGKEPVFQSQHLRTPRPGLALFINAFNFPAWGLWEKAAPALLSGMAVVVKPATATAWLTQRMVQDVVEAGILPPGALSVICGSSAGLLDALQPFDVLSFTGSAETAAVIRSHSAVTRHGVRTNIEADSLNSALLLPDAAPGSPAFDLLVREVVKEMTVKSGQKCTAIRRIFVPEPVFGAAAEAISARLAKVSVGNPRNEGVRMGSLVSREQLDNVQQGLRQLAGAAAVLYDGRGQPLVDADPAIAACQQPVLLGTMNADTAQAVHDVEVFGPVATLVTYRNVEHAHQLVQRGLGSLAVSLYGDDAAALARSTLALAPFHGRLHVVTPEAAQAHTGHGNVMPMSLHGGPGRAGGGEELGGLRALDFYHQRSAVQASPAVLDALGL